MKSFNYDEMVIAVGVDQANEFFTKFDPDFVVPEVEEPEVEEPQFNWVTRHLYFLDHQKEVEEELKKNEESVSDFTWAMVMTSDDRDIELDYFRDEDFAKETAKIIIEENSGWSIELIIDLENAKVYSPQLTVSLREI